MLAEKKQQQTNTQDKSRTCFNHTANANYLRSSTVSWAWSLPPYIAWEAHCEMVSCMRYWTESIRHTEAEFGETPTRARQSP